MGVQGDGEWEDRRWRGGRIGRKSSQRFLIGAQPWNAVPNLRYCKVCVNHDIHCKVG